MREFRARVKIYCGLSLQKGDVKRWLKGAEVAPPVRRGDIPADVKAGIQVIGIVDGGFEHSLAVSPGEILDALRSGVRVHGSSSMGALRAVELSDHGMKGHGEIYEWIRSEPRFRDDFLGQVFDTLPDGVAVPLSMTYADFRFALMALPKGGSHSSAAKGVLLKTFEGLFYAERNLYCLESRLSELKLNSLLPLARAVFATRMSQKRKDGIALLKAIRADLLWVKRENAARFPGLFRK